MLMPDSSKICGAKLAIRLLNAPESVRVAFVTAKGDRYYQNVNNGVAEIDCALIEGDTKITVRSGSKTWSLFPLHIEKVNDKYVTIPAPDVYGLISLLMKLSDEQAVKISKLEEGVTELKSIIDEMSGHDII
jgi:hypothetical protein